MHTIYRTCGKKLIDRISFLRICTQATLKNTTLRITRYTDGADWLRGYTLESCKSRIIRDIDIDF